MKKNWRQHSSFLIRVLLIIVLLASTFTYAVVQGGFTSWFIFYCLLPFSLYAIILAFMPLGKFTIVRELEESKLAQGDTLKLRVTMQRKFLWPILYILVEEITPHGIFAKVQFVKTKRLLHVGFKKRLTWQYEIEQIPRGKHQLQGVAVTVSDFFGWIKRQQYIKAKRTIIVYPKIERLIYRPLLKVKYGGHGRNANARKLDMAIVSGIRAYQPGDKIAWIHWKSFAKTGALQTKEFERQHTDEICVVLDGLGGPAFEEQVSFAASLFTSTVKQRQAISFLSAGKERFDRQAVQTEKQLQDVLYHLATIEAKPFDVEKKYGQDWRIREASIIYFITSNLTETWLQLLSRESASLSSCIIFYMQPQKQKLFMEDEQLVQIAKARGIRIIPLKAGHFDEAFVEGARK